MIIATVFAIFTFGAALPFITFEWFRQTKLSKYRFWSLGFVFLWAIIIGTNIWANSSGEGTTAYDIGGMIGALGFLSLLVFSPIIGFKSPDYSKIVPHVKRAKEAAE
jgi:hypothetical protein